MGRDGFGLCHRAIVKGFIVAFIIWMAGIQAVQAQEETGSEPLIPPAVPMEQDFPTDEEAAAPETPAASEAETGEKVIRYTVKEGDTLWDITRSIWQDPFLWPKVWRNNVYIINPDLIYPGNVILFPADLLKMLEEAEAERPPAAPPVEEAPEAPPVAPEVAVAPKPEPPPPPKPKLDLSLLASSGLILYDPKPTARVVGSLNDHVLLGENDVIFLTTLSKNALEAGDRLTLYRHVRKVHHPETGRYMGDLIRILGEVRITESKDRVRLAKIENSYDYTTIGDLAFPGPTAEFMGFLKEEPGPERKGNPPGESLKGYIIEVKEDRVGNAEYDIVYLDRGLKDGVRIGDRFVITRQGEKIAEGERKPKRVIGRLEVLMARDVTATARVVQSTEVVGRGDLFESVSAP